MATVKIGAWSFEDHRRSQTFADHRMLRGASDPRAEPASTNVALAALYARVLRPTAITLAGCTDSLASNYNPSAGVESGQCAYTCAALRDHFFGNSSRVHKCFLFNATENAWPPALLDTLRNTSNGNTVRIPIDEDWIVHGRHNASSNLPVTLDARFVTGAPLQLAFPVL